jgi:hypothetical protein
VYIHTLMYTNSIDYFIDIFAVFNFCNNRSIQIKKIASKNMTL